ncbi:hypothetical protein BU17DRAFT_68362 [Hysterangium stoloniferum]|nr:hypothetical protein BU17DRAFT_68362 [Hysterangium stoloniferum]
MLARLRQEATLQHVLGAVLIFTSVVTTAVNYFTKSALQPLGKYSFKGEDYPTYYPIDLPPVSLTPENTIHYQIYSIDAASEWASIFPDGGGFVYLGPRKRPFGLALFHQMHCLSRIRLAMAERDSSEHVHHCFNYLRQAILCDANPTIEPVVPILGRRSVNAEVPRVCRDWTRVYELAANSYHYAFNHTDGGRS